MLQGFIRVLAIGAGSLLLACSAQDSARITAQTQAAAAQSAVLRAELLLPKTVEPISATEFGQIIAAHRGEILLVNLWATWCKPCIKEIPELIRLQQKYRDQKFTVIAVSFDDVEDLEGKVRPFAKKQMPDFIHYLQNSDDPEKFVNVVDPAWNGVVPTNFIFDREGQLKATLSGGKSYEEFEAAVAPLVGQKTN